MVKYDHIVSFVVYIYIYLYIYISMVKYDHIVSFVVYIYTHSGVGSKHEIKTYAGGNPI